MTTENLNLSDLGLGDNSQAAVNEKLPRRGAEGRGQGRESRKSLLTKRCQDVVLRDAVKAVRAARAYPNTTQRVSLSACRCTLNAP